MPVAMNLRVVVIVKVKYLHIFNNTNEKFSEPFINFINSKFDADDHFFYHIGEDKRTNKVRRNNADFIKGFKYFNLVRDLYKAEKIFLHSLFFDYVLIILFMQPWLLKKCIWNMWGGDLYYYKYRNENLKSNIYEVIRKSVIKNMGGIMTVVRGDYELAQKWYHAKGKYYHSFTYPSNLYKGIMLSQDERDHDKIYIQLGNSADPSNNHLQILNQISKYKDEEIVIICPLSYGDVKHRDKTIESGIKIFADKFVPLTKFISIEEYTSLQSKIDIAVFGHERQQAMGNIITLLGMGKKVYMRKDTSQWKLFKDIDVNIYDADDFNLDLIEENKKTHNIKKIRTYFSEESLIRDLKTIFEDKMG